MPVRAVLFDFGGTLFRYSDMRPHFEDVLRSLTSDHGIEASFDDVRRAYREAMGRTMAEYATRPFYLHRALFAEAHARFLASFGKAPRSGEGDRFYQGQTELGVAQAMPRPEAQDVLAALCERGLHLGIVSNIDDDQFEALWQKLGLGRFFAAITTSEGARSCKPHEAIFRLALEKAGSPPPDEVLFVGDSPVHDVAGANAIGMRSVLIASGPRAERAPTACHVVDDLRELLAIVDA
jgi:2-haloalkanoic acid dehalogenase type II